MSELDQALRLATTNRNILWRIVKMQVTDRHIEICKQYTKSEINHQQAKFLLISNNLTDEQAEKLLNKFVNYVSFIYDVLTIGSVALLLVITMAMVLMIVSML